MIRRDFIKNSCLLCFSATAVGVMQLVQGCSPAIVYKAVAADNKVMVPLTVFQEKEAAIIRVKSESYDIAVIRRDALKYDAFEMRCTHADNELRYSGSNFECLLHGSIFDKTGRVTKGPAEKNLTAYLTEVSGDMLIIKL